MYITIILIPFLSFIWLSLFGHILNTKYAYYLSLFLIFICTSLSFFIFYEVILSNSICNIKFFSWINVNILNVKWGFLFDPLTSIMLIVVTFISALVHLYSVGYMSHDPHLIRFMSYLSLFTFFMLILITSDNFVQMFVGWEGVGLTSYLLINFWYTRIEANKAAMKALIINRIGDFGLILGIALIFFSFNSLDFGIVFSLVPKMIDENLIFFGFEIKKITIIVFLLFIGAVGKSAQIGLHTWLPDAMEGPTPVSALIHAATMVTAGVFVLLRCSPIIEYSHNMLILITIIGAITAFMAATIGIFQNDLKRVIAYSTCSQLGYMIFACGLSNYSISLFHLMNHAFFKALLFLSAGSIIHALFDQQDMRKMGGLTQLLPITYLMILVGSLSLMGFPFLTGFYSKDILLELTFASYKIHSNFAYWLGTISAFFTSFYSIRLIYLSFFNKPNTSKNIIKQAHESNNFIIIPLLILYFGSIFVGFLGKELFLGLGVTTWNNSLFILPNNCFTIESEFLPFYIKLIPVIFSSLGGLISLIVYYFININIKNYYTYYNFYTFFSKKWYFDIIYNNFITKYLFMFCYNISFKYIDRGLIEWFGPFGITKNFKNIIKIISNLQTGLIYHYAFLMIIGLIFFLFIINIFNFFNFSLLFLIIFIILTL